MRITLHVKIFQFIVIGLCMLMVGCSQLNPFNWFSSNSPKMTELKEVTATLNVRQTWSIQIGSAKGYLFQPAIIENQVYTAAADGTIARIELSTGHTIWRSDAKTKLSAGVSSNGQILVVGNPDGEVLAFSSLDGKLLWQAQVSSEIIATPVMTNDLVIVRSVDGRITAFDTRKGERRWIYQRPLPILTLRTLGGIAISPTMAFVGFPGGKLIALSLADGLPRWEATVSNPKGVTELERIADVTGTPQLQDKEVCAASYQGRIACFDVNTGDLHWSRDISSPNGLGLDTQYVFVADESSQVFAFSRTGASVWRQDQLRYRSVTQPVSSERSVVVADKEGVIHWLAREEGAFLARMKTDGSPIITPPQLLAHGILVQTTSGTLTVFSYE